MDKGPRRLNEDVSDNKGAMPLVSLTNSERDQLRKKDARELAELIYDTYKSKTTNIRVTIGQNNALQTQKAKFY